MRSVVQTSWLLIILAAGLLAMFTCFAIRRVDSIDSDGFVAIGVTRRAFAGRGNLEVWDNGCLYTIEGGFTRSELDRSRRLVESADGRYIAQQFGPGGSSAGYRIQVRSFENFNTIVETSCDKYGGCLSMTWTSKQLRVSTGVGKTLTWSAGELEFRAENTTGDSDKLLLDAFPERLTSELELIAKELSVDTEEHTAPLHFTIRTASWSKTADAIHGADYRMIDKSETEWIVSDGNRFYLCRVSAGSLKKTRSVFAPGYGYYIHNVRFTSDKDVIAAAIVLQGEFIDPMPELHAPTLVASLYLYDLREEQWTRLALFGSEFVVRKSGR